MIPFPFILSRYSQKVLWAFHRLWGVCNVHQALWGPLAGYVLLSLTLHYCLIRQVPSAFLDSYMDFFPPRTQLIQNTLPFSTTVGFLVFYTVLENTLLCLSYIHGFTVDPGKLRLHTPSTSHQNLWHVWNFRLCQWAQSAYTADSVLFKKGLAIISVSIMQTDFQFLHLLVFLVYLGTAWKQGQFRLYFQSLICIRMKKQTTVLSVHSGLVSH